MSRRELIFLDTSVVVHAVGNVGYAWAVTALQQGLNRVAPLATDVVSLQELEDVITDILGPHKARLIGQILQTATKALSVTPEDIAHAREIAYQSPQLSPRECLHVAVMSRAKIKEICTVLESNYGVVSGLRTLTLLEAVGG